MSAISNHGIRAVTTAVCLLGLGAIFAASTGCHGLPSAGVGPNAYEGSGGYDDADGDGWLMNGLLGRNAGSDSNADKTAGESAGQTGVHHASAIEPLPAIDGSKAAKDAVAGATVLSSTLSEEERERKEKASPSGLSLEDLDPQNAYKKLLVSTGFGPDKQTAEKLFAEGEELLRKKEYKQAAGKFKSAAARWPDSALEEDAMFFQAESQFFSDQYAKAQDTLDNLTKKYENSRYLDKIVLRLFSIGQYWEKMHQASPHWPVTPNVTDSSRPFFDTWGNAIKAYESVNMNDPTGPLADDSIMAIANAYFSQGSYEDAAYYYDRLRKEYPKSPHIIKAHMLDMKSKEMVYQGPMYDAKALEDAGEIAETVITQFGRELGEGRKKVVEGRNKIDAKMAQRDWEMAKYFETKKKYGGAKYYYRQIIKGFPNTEIARAAEKRLAEIKDFPDTPPNRFKWLTNLFPDGR